MAPCTILKDSVAASTGTSRFIFLPENPFGTGANPAFLATLTDLGYGRTLETDSTATLVKGVNDCDGFEAIPMAACGGVKAEAATACDIWWTADGTYVSGHPQRRVVLFGLCIGTANNDGSRTG